MRRSVEDQSLHDVIIGWLRHALGERGQTSFENPGQEKNFPVGGHYPDVVVVEEQNAEVHLIDHLYEVETDASVNDTEAVHQWKPYSELGAPLTLVVPEDYVVEAIRLLDEYEIAASIVPYGIDGDGRVQFEWPGE